MKARTKSRTADLFAEADASPALTPAPVPPTLQTAGHARPKQLWYAAIFPELKENSAAVLQRLCLHAQQFTSFVSIDPPNALLLEIKGSLKLFGPIERLHSGIDACWRRLELPVYSATAPSTLAALWLARGRPCTGVFEDPATLAGNLAKLPIACTAWDAERLQTLRAMGVMRIGELLRLPRAGLVRRLGAATLQDLDIALARQAAPRRAFVPRERFRTRCDFETEIENVAYLEKALEPLIGRCAQFLRERQAGVQALRLKLRHRAGPATSVHVGLASTTGECRRLKDVLTQKLWRLELPKPVRGMELTSGSLLPLSANSLDIFAGLAGVSLGAGADGRDTAPQLVERLRARLGEDAVYGVASIQEHRPEAAWRRVQELRLASTVREKMADPMMNDQSMPRPVWLLDAPLAISLPDLQEFLILEQGPERIESGWWDGRGVARDYYIARQCGGRKPKPTPVGAPEVREPRMGERQCGGRKPKPTPVGAPEGRGAKLWVFQERQSKRWYLHGMFA